MVKRLLIATFVAVSPLLAVAQGLITGHITDARTGEPLIGASVIVKSEKGQGVVTDVDGNFSLQTKVEAPLTLRAEYVGYRPLDVDVYDFDEPVEIALAENINSIEGIVVTGVAQGTTRKGLSFALTKISDDLINTVPQSDASTTLRGKVAGIRIEQSNGNAGAKVYQRQYRATHRHRWICDLPLALGYQPYGYRDHRGGKGCRRISSLWYAW